MGNAIDIQDFSSSIEEYLKDEKERKFLESDVEGYLTVREGALDRDFNNKEFQSAFSSLYKLRRNPEFKAEYFKLMERQASEARKMSMNEVGDDEQREQYVREVIEELKKAPGNIELSFATKLLSTVYDDIPIWDSYVEAVVKQLNPKGYKESLFSIDPIDRALAKYRLLEQIYADLKSSGKDEELIRLFDEQIGTLCNDIEEIPDNKKIDYVLWIKGWDILNKKGER